MGFWVTAWATPPGHGFRSEDGNEKDARVSECSTPGIKGKTKITVAAGHVEIGFHKIGVFKGRFFFPSAFLDL